MSQKGFTLVELAIVLMIIGLLIGGILKGQELIKNARIVSLARQIEGYRAAVLTFSDSYGALPGDIANPSTRVPNCTTTPCSTGGDANGQVGTTKSMAADSGFGMVVASENGNFWEHMFKANVLSGGLSGKVALDSSALATVSAPIGSEMSIGYMRSAATGNYPAFTGHFLLLKPSFNLPTASVTYADAGNYDVSPSDAARIDRKMDDGKPYAGDVMGAGAAACFASLEYANSNSAACNLLIRLF